MKNCQKVSLIMLLTFCIILLSSACASASPATAPSKQVETAAPIILTYATPYPETHAYSISTKMWIEYIQKETGGRVQIKPYWGGTLITGTEPLAEIAKGVADAGYAPNFQTKGFEINTAMTTFLANSPNADTTVKTSLDIFNKFPQWGKEYGQGKDLKVFGFSSGIPITLMSNKQINKLSDLKGLRISVEASVHPVLQELGASGQMMPAPEIYIGLQKGIVDGVMLPLETLKTLKFADVTKYVISGISVAAPARPIDFINWQSYSKLPPDIQKIIENSIANLAKWRLEIFLKSQQDALNLAKDQGLKFIDLTSDDLNSWQSMWKKQALNSAKQANDAGKPGTEIMNECEQLLTKYSK